MSTASGESAVVGSSAMGARLATLLVVLLGTLLSVALAGLAYETSRELGRIRFQQQAGALMAALENAVTAATEKVRAHADLLYSHRGIPTRNEFETFAKPAIERLPQIYSMTLTQAVPAAEREKWEAELRSEHGEGAGIWEWGAERERVPAGVRPIYYPVRFIEPDEAEIALGFDTASTPERLEAVERARDTGEPAATGVLHLVPDPKHELSVILFVPVYSTPRVPETVEERRAAHIGFATAGFRMRTLLQRALAKAPMADLRLSMLDVTGDTPTVLGVWPGRESSVDVAALQAGLRSGQAMRYDVDMGGRKWAVVAEPGPMYTSGHWVQPMLVLAMGVSFTWATAMLLGFSLRRNRLLGELARTRSEHAAALQQQVTERAIAQRALASANEDLRRLNLEMEQFVSAVSHDLKNPLLAIDWAAGAIKRAVEGGNTERLEAGVANMMKAAGSMRRIIDDLIAHARAGWAQMNADQVNIREIVKRVLDERGEEVRRRGVVTEVDGELPTICGDAGRLTAAMDNLITNALKYGCTGASPRIRVGCETVGDEVRIFVEDNGPGVPANHRERVFQLFQRLARDEDGTGIGLAIVDRVARAHRGRAWVDDAPGGGARFWIALPRGQHSEQEAQNPLLQGPITSR